MGILLDTNFIFALIAEKDKYHGDAKRIFNSDILDLNQPLSTSCLVVNEAYTLAMYRTKRDENLINELNSLIYGKKKFFNIYYFKRVDYQEIFNIFMKYSDSKKILSFVDASLIYLSKNNNYEWIVSFDDHFDGIIERIY